MASDDERLDALIRDLGRHARQTAPPFERVWRAAEMRRAPARPQAIAALGAAVVAACVAVALTIVTAPATDVVVAAWRSPTAFLLATPGRAWLATPRLRESTIGDFGMRLEPLKEKR